MKLISLNTYGGTFYEPLMEFVREHAPTTDIFCFQEVLNGVRTAQTNRAACVDFLVQLQKVLPNHASWFAESESNLTFSEDAPGTVGVPYGLALFVNKKHTVTAQGDFFIYRHRNSFVPRNYATLGHNAQYITINSGGHAFTVYNVHGTSEPGSKLDTPERLVQSQKIIEHAKAMPSDKIITGDFNLLPHTKSVSMFTECGYQNLVTDFKIKSTRGTLLKKLHPEYANTPVGFQEFADYTFITPGIKPLSYVVPDIPVSDHLPLILEFNF